MREIKQLLHTQAIQAGYINIYTQYLEEASTTVYQQLALLLAEWAYQCFYTLRIHFKTLL